MSGPPGGEGVAEVATDLLPNMVHPRVQHERSSTRSYAFSVWFQFLSVELPLGNLRVLILNGNRHFSSRTIQIIITPYYIRRPTQNRGTSCHRTTFPSGRLTNVHIRLMKMLIRITLRTIGLRHLHSISKGRPIMMTLFHRILMVIRDNLINRRRQTFSITFSDPLIKQRHRRGLIRAPRIQFNFRKSIL